MATDEERGSVHYITGFGGLASLIASDADHTTAVYKRFDKLAARDLLYYESELLELEALQDQYDCEDAQDARKSDNAEDVRRRIRTNARNWVAFKHGAAGEQDADGRWKKRMKLATEIRSTLKEYRLFPCPNLPSTSFQSPTNPIHPISLGEALLLNSSLLALRPPSKQTLTTLSSCFHQQHTLAATPAGLPKTSPTLSGASSSLYPLPNTPTSQQPTDLVSLSPQMRTDPLTRFLKTYCWWLFRPRSGSPLTSPSSSATKPLITHLAPPQLGTYSLPFLSFTVSLVTTLLTSILLFLPIYVLYRTPASRPGMKLGFIGLFTVLFAGTIPLVTNARRAEVFAACAAYAAVLVVFVSGDLGGGAGAGCGASEGVG